MGHQSGTHKPFAIVTVGILACVLSACGSSSDRSMPSNDSVELAQTSLASKGSAGGESGTDPETVRRSEEIQKALSPMHSFIERGGKGFARTKIDIAERSATIQWKRPVPAEISALEGTADSGVTIRVEPVPFSESDVDQAVKRLQDAAKSGEIPRPLSYRANQQFDGLQVGYAESDLANASKPETMAALERIAAMPVSVASDTPVLPANVE